MRSLLILPLLLSVSTFQVKAMDLQFIRKIEAGPDEGFVNCKTQEMILSKDDAAFLTSTWGVIPPIEGDRWYSKEEINKRVMDDFFDGMAFGLCD